MTQPVYKHAESLTIKLARAHARSIRTAQNWCAEHNYTLKTFSEADPYDICIVSKSEYDLHEFRKDIAEDNDSRFLEPNGYEEWCVE
jgi:hypothetical protein